MSSLFTTEFYKKNRDSLKALLPNDAIIVIPGNGLMQRTADTHYPFRQDSSLLYLTGITEPCVTLVINCKTNEEWLMVERREGVQAIFDGVIDDDALRSTSGIYTVISDTEGWRLLKTYHSNNWYAPVKIAAKIGSMYTNPHRSKVVTKLSRSVNAPIQAVQPFIAKLRVIKQPAELLAIDKAIQITNDAIKYCSDHLSDFSNERDVAIRLLELFIQAGADGHAFDPIVASATASCTLHYIDNNQPIKNNAVLLLDVGAEYQGYAADISRTLYVGTNKNTRHHNVLQAVAAAQEQIIQYVKPGISWRQLADFANAEVAKQLVALGLITNTATEADIQKYFPHAVSHFMGLDVHDIGDYSAPLQEGMVITVEPGIYIKEESFGVRIEDDILITKSSAKILSNSLPSLL